MSCSAHAQFPAGKPVAVSVNGVAIARDAIVREMQHHPAGKPIAAWQQAARALVVRELLLQRASVIERDAGTDQRRRGPARDRRRGDHARGGRARGHRPRARRRRPAGAITNNNKARFRSPDIYEASHILFAALPADPEAYAQAQVDAAGGAGGVAGAPGTLCRPGAGLFALSVGGAGRQSRADHRGTNDARIREGADGAFARETCAAAGGDALRLPHHPA